mmetsp:Transcript_18244/g.27359  ORF Transcript_18244/g.27359 Transcript_18244/m.27359 type:complete len:207 (+) Transcript_18244:103-723(+)
MYTYINRKPNESKRSSEKRFLSFLKKAEDGDALHQYRVGKCYLYGDGVMRDEYSAVKFLKKSANQGLKEGQYLLGVCCYESKVEGIRDYKNAVTLFRKATKQGHIDAQYWLGYCYYNGTGIKINYKKAFEYFEKSVSHGHISARWWLGEMSRRHPKLVEAFKRMRMRAADMKSNACYLKPLMRDAKIISMLHVEIIRAANDSGWWN